MLLHESANMEQSVPENLSTHVFNDCEMKLQTQSSHDPNDSENGSNSNSDMPTKECVLTPSPATSVINSNTSVASNNNNNNSNSNSNTTKVKLSFSVDRLLSAERISPLTSCPNPTATRQCCDGSVFACCTLPSCFGHSTEAAKHTPVSANQPVMTNSHGYSYAGLDKFYPGLYMDYKSVLRPTPIRAADHATTFPTLATNALMRFHQQQQQQHQHHQQHIHSQHQQKPATLLHNTTASTALLAPLNGLKTLQLTQQQRFLGKAAQQQLLDIPTAATGAAGTQQNGVHSSNNNSNNNANGNNNANNNGNNNNNNGKRKRSWSRAVFTNLQRKGLEIQFQQQKYITKPDRRKLAARLNLTDAQVKVWFQNRRMKWRHTRENLKSGQEKQPTAPQGNGVASGAVATKPTIMLTPAAVAARLQEQLEYSSDSCSSAELSEKADDDDNIEIDVVE